MAVHGQMLRKLLASRQKNTVSRFEDYITRISFYVLVALANAGSSQVGV
jgi:hypothetical protein